MTVSNNGIFNNRVGIGTTTPAVKLDVNGDASISNGLNTTFIVGNQTSASTQSSFKQYGKSSGGTALSATWNLTTGGLYNLGFQTVTSTLNISTVTGYVGILNINNKASLLAPLSVGDRNVNNSRDSQILITRNVDDTIAGNGHAFSDSSLVNRSGTIGYNSYDARINFSGSYNYDHYAGFQFAPTISTSGTFNNVYGFAIASNYGGGLLTNMYGFYAVDPTGAGSITNNYGFYSENLIRGTNNYAIYTAGATKSYFGGNVGIGTTTPAYNLEVSSSASTTVMIGSGALTGCLGIGDTDKAGITWCTALNGTLTCSDVKPQQCK